MGPEGIWNSQYGKVCVETQNRVLAEGGCEMGENRIYKIEDIARELGISTSTVSRSISGKGRISQATRERVLDFISSHDYRPSVQAKGLAQNKTYNLGLVLPLDFSESSPAFFKECMSGICETAAGNNYDVMLSLTDGQDLSQISRLVVNRKVDGIIISRSAADWKVEHFLKEKNVPFVLIGSSPDPDVFFVDNNNREACRELTDILLMKGIRRMALVGGSVLHRVNEDRKQGFLEAHQDFGVPADQRLFFMEVDRPAKAADALEEILGAKADGIVCMDDSTCALMLGCLRERGLQIPREIRLASFYDSVRLEYNNPSVTSLRFGAKDLGQSACRILLDLLNGRPVKRNILPGYQVILRESTK